jgi:cystine transport system substrate-binding protein
VKKEGVLKIGTEGAWAPFIYNDTQNGNELVGFEVEWAEAIGKELGVKIDWNVSSQWDGVVAGLDAKRYDAIFCAVALTDYSSDKYSFTDPYYKMKTVLVTATDNDDIKTVDDLNGKVVGNSPQGVWGQLATAAGADVRNMNLTEAADNIKTGRIAATLNSELAILDYLKTSGDTGIKIASYYEPKDPREETIVALFNKGNDELIAEVNKAIRTIITNGTAAELSLKYFGKDIYEGDNFYE